MAKAKCGVCKKEFISQDLLDAHKKYTPCGQVNFRQKDSDKGVLVIKRKEDQSLIINEDIEIKVTRTSTGSCRLVIIAPKSVPIRRKELN
jgi:hypothetical protein